MPQVPAKCPSCGGDMQIDGSRKEAFCPYCGSKFLVESAVNYYNTKNEYHIEHADISVEDSRGLEAKLRNADAHLKLKKYNKAAKMFEEMTKEFADDYRGWWGIVRAETREFTGARICCGGTHVSEILSISVLPRDDMGAYLFKMFGGKYNDGYYDIHGDVLEVPYRAVEYYKNIAVSFAPPEQVAAMEKEWASYTQKVKGCRGRYEEALKRGEQRFELQKTYDSCKKQLDGKKMFKGRLTERMELLKADIEKMEQEGDIAYQSSAVFLEFEGEIKMLRYDE